MHSIETTSMPVNLRQIARRAVLKHKGYNEMTLASIEKAKADCEAERQRVRESTGLQIDADGVMHLSEQQKASLERRLELEDMDCIADIIQRRGFPTFSIWATAVAARLGEKLK